VLTEWDHEALVTRRSWPTTDCRPMWRKINLPLVMERSRIHLWLCDSHHSSDHQPGIYDMLQVWHSCSFSWIATPVSSPLFILIIIFSYTLQPFKAYCVIWVRCSNFCHQASPRVTARERPTAEVGTVGEKCPVILPKCRLPCYI